MSSKSTANESIIDIEERQRHRNQVENDEYDLNQSATSLDSRHYHDDSESDLSTTLDSNRDNTRDNTRDNLRDLSIDDGEIFNENKVDQLVDSFWTKFDKKIEHAVLQQQEAQKIKDQEIRNKIQEEEEKTRLAIEKHTEFFNFSYSFIYIIEFLLRIWVLFTTRVSHKIKSCGDFIYSIPWRDKLAFYVFHRHAHFMVVLLSIVDLTLVCLIILNDFDFIDGRGNEVLFMAFQRACVAIMFCFLLEVVLKLLSVGKKLVEDRLELFDIVTVVFYFCAELIASNALSNLDGNYPKYMHIIVALRLWRIVLLFYETFVLEKT